MKRLLDWLAQEKKGSAILFFIMNCVGASALYTMIAGALTVFLLPDSFFNDTPLLDEMHRLGAFLPFIVLGAAAAEELLFRLPLALAVWRWGTSWKVVLSAVILSAIFGAVHGTLMHIFIQGVIGLVLSTVFLKCGGFQGRYVKATVASSATHAMFNGVLITLALVAEQIG